MIRKCKVEGCDRDAVRGAFLCTLHLGEKRRCEGRVREYDERGNIISDRQCKRSAKPGLTVCHDHGGSGPKSMEVSMRTAALTTMQRFVRPYSGQLDPVTAFEEEFRRTYGRIKWLEEQIAGLEDEKDLIWGMTRQEEVTATEFAGTNSTYEARIHVYEEMLRWERKHFLDLEKVWIRANLDEKKLQVMRNHIDYTYVKMLEAARALGHDPDNPEVREVLMGLFARRIEP